MNTNFFYCQKLRESQVIKIIEKNTIMYIKKSKILIISV